jgi:hypothetical protein
MAGNNTRKQQLSAMLDADLEQCEGAQDAGMAEDVQEQPSRPTTLGELMQTASADQLRGTLRSLLAERPEVNTQLKGLLEDERSHQAWVDKQEAAWQKRPEQDAAETSAKTVNAPIITEDFEGQCRFIPLRPTAEERSLLQILGGALYVSEYTDQVDVYHTGNTSRRMVLQIKQVCAIVAGLVVANNFDVAKKPLMEKTFAENRHFFRAVFEIGRRHKILNPDKLRGSYGKLIHMLQDSVKDEVVRLVEFECVAPVRTVFTLVAEKGQRGVAVLRDPLLNVATREIYTGSKTRQEVAQEVAEKNEALKELKRKYSEKLPEGQPARKSAGDLGELLRGKQTENQIMSEDNVDTIVSSISDHFAFQRFNREPCDRMIEFLKSNFSPTSEKNWSLEIARGRGGSCLSHNHRTQYTFVLQSLLLWREIMGNMFALWQMTEEDLLDPALRYRLCDTGQGLNRMQSAPRVSKMMHQILHKVQSELGGWVGLSVVHLGDRDVPNALVFIDKYTQVPRILGPLVQTLDRLPEIYASTPAMKKLMDNEFGGLETLRMTILQDFFRHGFDGSGDDGGSCIDGRLTSCWNWCSKIEKKKYFTAFLVTGFTGFDGGFESGGGW